MGMLLAFVGALFAYRLWLVPHSGISLFFDEAQYWDWSEHLAWGYFSKPPLIAGLIWLSTHLFGDSVLGVKAVVMALYPITALSMVGLARALWPTEGGVRTGMVAAALFATIPTVALMGLFASTDAPLILCWTLASWALWRAQATDQLRYWVAVGVVCGIGLLGKYTMAAFALTALWTLWGVPGPRRGILRAGPWVAIVMAALMLSPNLIWNAHNGFPTLHHTAELTTSSNRGGGVVPTLVFLAGQALMLGPVAVLAGLWLLRRSANGGVAGTAPTKASYHFLWAMSLPLQAIAVVQAFHADAHVNWAAPSMVGFCLLIASRLSRPELPLAAVRPRGWLIAALASNIVLTSAVLQARDIAGPTLPSRLDAMVRMRGWQEVFTALAPAIEQADTRGLPVLTESRLLITHAAYNWRQHGVQTVIWNPQRTVNNHYELTRSLPNQAGADVVLVTESSNPAGIAQRFASSTLLRSAKVAVGPDRFIELHAFVLRGFKGYDTPPNGAQPARRDNED